MDKILKIYLDNCCFNRPFDDQKQIKLRLESEAKLFIQDKIIRNEVKLVWSYILDTDYVLNSARCNSIQSKDWRFSICFIDLQKKSVKIPVSGTSEILTV